MKLKPSVNNIFNHIFKDTNIMEKKGVKNHFQDILVDFVQKKKDILVDISFLLHM